MVKILAPPLPESSATGYASKPRPRRFGMMNWLGFWVLTCRETGRFLKVHVQTILSPAVTTLLYYAVFALAFGGESKTIGSTPFLTFLAPGLIMMAIAQNAFANTSSSLLIAKVQGNIVDLLMPPLSPLELTLGFTIGGVARGLAVGTVCLLCLAAFTDISGMHPAYIIYHAIMGSMMMALLGLVGGIWSSKFDHIAALQNFIIMPATFLSGTFYETSSLPPIWATICRMNPFFYMIDGFRYGFTGHQDGNLLIGVIVLAVCNLALSVGAYIMFATGYKLKS
ncbi:MAG: ABC transporter permease [Bdellovibrionales bacterium]